VRRAFLFFVCVLGCRAPQPTVGTPPPRRAPKVVHPEPRGPGARLAAAKTIGRGVEVPSVFVEERPELAGIFPSPAYSAEERYGFGDQPFVCRAAFYDADVPSPGSAHPQFHALVAALAGDDRYAEAKATVSGARLWLRRERFCIYHECKPPLSAPTVQLDVCIDEKVSEPRAIVHAILRFMPVLAGHEDLLSLEGVRASSIRYSRNGDARDEQQLSLVANEGGLARVRTFLVDHAFAAVSDPEWSMKSTTPKRSYLMYPPQDENSITISGRAK